MLYYPSARELGKLHPRIKEMLSGSSLEFANPVPIETERQARQYLALKVDKYKDLLPYTGSNEIIVDKYIANAMNKLLAAGFTYINLYAKDNIFLTEPHVASALAFNELNNIDDVPDEVDNLFGLTYARE